MIILQVVGYKNSGKTRLSSYFIREGTAEGFKVGSIKHHAHGTPDIIEETDSAKHMKSGAEIAGVYGGGRLDLSIMNEEFSIARLAECYEKMGINLLIIEGFKQESYPKVVLLREDNDLQILQDVKNVVAVVCNNGCDTITNAQWPSFQSSDLKNISLWYATFLKSPPSVK
ncbi:molybdopterin-guanine dinucleotide biosynthesis protein B [Bacillus carboniphilus]|uniref:Molybdopterin-guanine dinucleotide biosynthesis protein B n=1 Tax=Bacillus carboniphilus TaxID=86663 RepID=A0ABY9JVS7_9BACI|nr:molybdopterin-guanine dinucleotide biosynthesis protein B [Bacillus carboniphilus]WLR42378.1 molybdopterin-guanine dinucleotide biosynthesis protein B [Bacillus carboniphilus]